MKRYKFRIIASSKSNKVYGLTIPNDIAMFFSGCSFFIEKSGTCIVLKSGGSLEPTENLNEYSFEDCKI